MDDYHYEFNIDSKSSLNYAKNRQSQNKMNMNKDVEMMKKLEKL